MKNLVFSFICLFLTIPCAAEIIIVDDDWPYDFNNIQAAINYSTNGDFIFVFPGTYSGPGNKDINFNGKDITVQSVAPENPYIVAATVIDCNNYYARGFIFDSGEDANSVLAGFTITNSDGAIHCRNSSSPTITYCIMTGNSIGYGAGGIYLEDSNSIITNCTITNNIGSGIWCSHYSSPTIANCIITGNTGFGLPPGTRAGGIYCEKFCSPTITNCIITGNAVGYDGGGIYCGYDSSPKIINCTITGNSAKYDGGGIYFGSHSSIFITNSIVWGNTDISGQGQSAQIYDDGDGTLPDIWFSCIQDGNSDDANVPFGIENFNIDDDPCFVLPGTGYWDDNNTPGDTYDDFWVWVEGDYHLLAASPCIEAGNPYFTYHPGDVDMDGQPRLLGQRVDMGADEFEIAIIVVTKPHGGEVWTNGSTHEINWDSFGITGTVDIYYSTNNGADWLMIDNTTDSGSYMWQLPGAVDSNQCLVAVEPNAPVPDIICIESGVFTIHPDSPGPAVVSKWKSLGGDFDRAGLSENFGPELGCVKWQFQTDGPVSASPTVGADDRVHLSCEDGKVYTLDANGVLLWSYDTNSPLLSSPTIGPDGTVYVGGQDEKLYAIDVNGNLRWTHNTDGFIYSSPAVSPDGNVYACSQDGTLYALGRDGSELWTFETVGPGVATGAIFASPAIGPNGTVYIAGVYDPNLYALDANDGSVKWNCNFIDPCDPNSEQPWPFASPVIAADGTIYQTLLYNPKRLVGEPGPEPLYEAVWYDSKLYAIDPNNGNIVWATNMTETATQEEHYPHGGPFPPDYQEPNYWFKQYYAYVYTRYPEEEGIPPYPYTTTDVGGWGFVRYYRVSNSSFSEPALAPDGTIYVSFDDQYLRAVDPNGTIKWVTSLGWLGGFTLTVGSDGLIYAAGDEGYLYVLDPNGEEIARFGTDDWLSFPVIMADNTIIVSDSNNTVLALGADGCEGQTAALHRPEDLSADWAFNFIDFAIVAADWLQCTDTSYDPETEAPYCDYNDDEFFLAGDINRDQYVNLADVAALAYRWLTED